MRPWCIRTLWQRNAKNNEKLLVIIPQASANNMICSNTCFYFLRTSRQKKTKQTGGGKWRSCYRCTWYTYHIKDALDNHEQTGGGAGCERPRQRGTDASFTCTWYAELSRTDPFSHTWYLVRNTAWTSLSGLGVRCSVYVTPLSPKLCPTL